MNNRSRLDEARRLLAKVGSSELLAGYLAQSLACEQHDSRSIAREIQAPALILAGREDTITTPEHAQDLANTIAGAELKILPRGMHGFWREFPDDVNPIVVEFLQRH